MCVSMDHDRELVDLLNIARDGQHMKVAHHLPRTVLIATFRLETVQYKRAV